MADTYDHKAIEQKWQKRWSDEALYETPDEKPAADNEYVLVEFPYPSGNLHIGHWYAFAVPDIFVRKRRMEGKNVLFPIGFDSFGLPAENAAIKRGVDPREWTNGNIAHMTDQLKQMGNAFDWRRMVIASEPDYYRWTQWLFLELFKNNLAYRGTAEVNWCPSCKTVLANEQVIDGRCERCDTEVIQKELEQWFFKITTYADRLLEGLEDLRWPEEIKQAQRNWIGKSEGAEITFELSEKKNYVFIHGYKSSPEKNFWPWLREALEKRGHSVQTLELPNPDDPNVSEQIRSVRENAHLTENTVVIAHSLGCPVALKALEESPVQIDRLMLVAGFMEPHFVDHPRPFADTFNWEFDAEKTRNNIGSIEYLRPTDDDAVPHEAAEKMKAVLGGTIIDFDPVKPHARAQEEPAVLRYAVPHVRVFTTRPDTLYGATYLVLSPEHPLLASGGVSPENADEVARYIEQAKQKDEEERVENKEKTGKKLEGVSAVNPATGEDIPIFVADYVLASYGTGAIMAVPAHDERDFAFAEKYDIEIRQVVESGNEEMPYEDEGALINSGEFTGMESEEAKKKITEHVGGTWTATYRLRDWLISRQRYWGAPIPVVYDPDGKPHAVPEEHLPWTLPDDVDFTPTGEAPLARSHELKERTERIFGKGWRPEVDTMDTFVDSAWYYLRYLDPKNEQEFSSKEKQQAWMPVDIYSGGAEHTTMHVLYSRFFYKVLFDLGLVAESTGDEPYTVRMNRSLILGPDGNKMSKSKGNVIDPDTEVARVGADTVKMYLAFIGPYNETSAYPWDSGGLVGVRRFLERVWRLQGKIGDTALTPYIEAELHNTIKKVTDDINSFKFNTAISSLMEFQRTLENDASENDAAVSAAAFDILLRLLAPFAPHLSEELWHLRGYEESVHTASWPAYDESKMVSDTLQVVVQVNGKLRGIIHVPADAQEGEVTAKAREAAAKNLSGKEVRKTVYVPGKLVNFVVGEKG